ncbi:hypothetical protein CAPTEDRAFT_192340 [Capitella teleta]|uniref:Uncharacterized protein n=1 Tax=Capitella teleta TaxID=283909 RepID=R7UKG1_CAPTE|nr:hypothetical protein CAPTEDRAFT_192340 [Capitella teleta]|eukprot:ELU03772.1 hypothetical protein CAPTEDRAFT_192340 [Capitella teleta]
MFSASGLLHGRSASTTTTKSMEQNIELTNGSNDDDDSMMMQGDQAKAQQVSVFALATPFKQALVAIMIEVKEKIIHKQGEVDRLKITSPPQGREATEALSFLFEILQFDEEGEFGDFCSGLTGNRCSYTIFSSRASMAVRTKTGKVTKSVRQEMEIHVKRWISNRSNQAANIASQRQ